MKIFIISLLKDNLPEFYSEDRNGENEALLTRPKVTIFSIELPINKN